MMQYCYRQLCNYRAPLKMHFFRDGCVTDFCSCKIGIQYILYITSVLESSWLTYTLRFSTLAPGFVLGNCSVFVPDATLPIPSMESSCIALPPPSMAAYHLHPCKRHGDDNPFSRIQKNTKSICVHFMCCNLSFQ